MKRILTLIIALVPGVLLGATYYVDASRPDDSGDGLSWAAAKQTIQAAVNIAANGDTVLVTNGLYKTGATITPSGGCSNRLVITKRILVESVNGPDGTVIVGAGPLGSNAVRCVYLSAGMLSGFTLTNGHTWTAGSTLRDSNGGGVNMYGTTRGTITNCVITGNYALNGGGMSYGTAYCCHVSGNLAIENGGGAHYTVVDGGSVAGNVSSNRGGGTYNCRVQNVQITGNAAASDAGGMYGGSAVATLISANEAHADGGGARATILSNCIVRGNTARYGGGLCYGAARNCAVHGNTAAHMGGGSYDSTLHNCTIAGNRAGTYGGGVAMAGAYNTIVYHNQSAANENWRNAALSNCCCWPLPDGGNCISNDPLLASLTHIAPWSPCVGAGSSNDASGLDLDGEPWRPAPAIGCDEPYAGALTGRLDVAIDAVYSAAVAGVALDFAAVIDGIVMSNHWTFGDGGEAAMRLACTHAWAATGQYAVVLTGFNESHPQGVSATLVVQVVTYDEATVYAASGNPAAAYPYTNWVTAARTLQDAVDAAEASGIAGAHVLASNGVYATGGRAAGAGHLHNRVVMLQDLRVESLAGRRHTVILGAGPLGPGAARCVYLASGVLSGFTISNGHTFADGTGSNNDGGGVYGPKESAFELRAQAKAAPLGGGGGGGGDDWGTGGGGGSYTGGTGNGMVTDCVIVACHAFDQGGGAANTLVLDTELCENTSQQGGGAYNCACTQCYVHGNNAAGDGGGMFACLADQCVLAGNTAVRGAGFAQSGLAHCIVSGNYAGADGGGGGAYSQADNSLFHANHAGASGGGAFMCDMMNCTVVGNEALWGGGVCSGYCYNTIIWSNTAANASNNVLDATLTFCCSQPLEAGIGNLAAEPHFASAADFHVQWPSPCINAGSNFVPLAAMHDLDGNPRILPPGGIVDMGCYEYVPEPAAGLLILVAVCSVPFMIRRNRQ